MEYFYLTQDPRLRNAIWLNSNFDQMSVKARLQGAVRPLDDVSAFVVRPGKKNQYPAVLNKQLFLVDKKIKDVFGLVIPKLYCKMICAMDLENRQHAYYYAPELELVDCFDPKSTCNLDRSVIKQMVIRQDAVEGRDILRVDRVNCHAVVVSLRVAEAIMRRKPWGAQLTRVEVI